MIALAAAATPAGAASNGLIAFETMASSRTIATVDPITPPIDGFPRTSGVPGLPSDSADAAWSADGTMLAFSSSAAGRWDVYVINADGTGRRRITRDPVAAIDPTWSPDGRRIAFTSLRNGAPDIYVTDIGGGSLRQLTNAPGVDQQADWSPDGTQIAFESDRSGSHHIWLMAASDGSAQQQLTRGPVEEVEAAWSPDGTRLAFSAGAPGTRVISSIDRSGGDRRQLTRAGEPAGFPAWSPDGRQIAFFTNNSVAVMPSSGTSGSPPEIVATRATDPVWARLPMPAGVPSGTISINGDKVPASARLPSLPTGTEVDATDGSLLVNFDRPQAPAAAPVSSALVTGAEFAVGAQTSETLTLLIKPPDCSTAPAGAAVAARARRRRSRTKVRNGRFKIKNKHLIAASHLTAYVVTETCRGSFVKVTEGLVDVRPRRGRRRVVQLRAGESYFVAARR